MSEKITTTTTSPSGHWPEYETTTLPEDYFRRQEEPKLIRVGYYVVYEYENNKRNKR